MSVVRWIVPLAVVSLLSACGSSEPGCIDPDEPYLAARNNQQLHVPDGLTQPNRSEALNIPSDKAAAGKPGTNACLDAPPS